MKPDEILITHQWVSPEEEELVRSQVAGSLNLDFFGAPTRLYVKSEQELKQWRHFFKHFLTTDEEPVVTVWLGIDGNNDSFFQSIFRKDYPVKSIYVESDEPFQLWTRFNYWSQVMTPIPPFQFSPLKDQTTVFNSGAVSPPGADRAVLFMAPPYQGKSTLTNGWVGQGGFPLADNLTVVRNRDLMVLPYLTPTGIREETVHMLPGLEESVAKVSDNWTTVSEVTGKVYMVHFDELHSFPPPRPCPLGLIVFPVNHRGANTDTFRLRSLEPSELREWLLRYRVEVDVDPEALEDTLDRLCQIRALELNYDLANCNVSDVLKALTSDKSLANP